MDFIDTHQHLIYRDRVGYSWTKDQPALATGDFTQADYDRLTDGLGIAGKVFMEVGVDDADYQTEARFIAGLVGTHGLLGQVASIRPDIDEGFDAWLDACRDLHVVGFRRILHESPDELSQSDTFRRNLRKIGVAGLPFDINVLARQLPVAEALVRACPDQTYVLDHCGVPDIAGDGYDGWAVGISAMARLPQVVVKLSGIAAYCATGTASVTVFAPYVDHLLATFGPDRMLWGSDWPVVNLGMPLTDWIAASRALIGGLSGDEQFAIAQGTARRVYGLA
jgi:predicted TIM-barrel fold metal-dependent hydrolase